MKSLIRFYINSVLLGAGLAMDAFTVSIANGLRESNMKRSEALRIAGTFGGFQALMPLIGWVCVRTIAETFTAFQKLIPWIALILLVWIGGGMILEGDRGGGEEETAGTGVIGTRELLVQGLATSIDALSVGFAIAGYSFPEALQACILIGGVTLVICLVGLRVGKQVGARLTALAPILGGIILIGIGLEIFFSA